MNTEKPYQDVLTEMLVGQVGAIRCAGKFYIMPTRTTINDLPLTLVAGAVVTPEGKRLVIEENKERSEMWEGEIILLPKRKYSGRRSDGSIVMAGWRVDQVLSGRYGDADIWGPKYFDVAEIKEAI